VSPKLLHRIVNLLPARAGHGKYTSGTLHDNDFPKRFGFGFMTVSSKLLLAKLNESISEERGGKNWIEVKSEACKAPRHDSRSREGGRGFRLHNLRGAEQFRLRERRHAQPD